MKNRKTNPYENIRTQKKEKRKRKKEKGKKKNTEPCLSELLNAIHNDDEDNNVAGMFSDSA